MDGTALHHIVLMKFLDRSDASEAKRRLLEMAPAVPQIRSMTVELDEAGTAVSYDLCMTTRHDSAEELSGYQGHPAHLELASWLKPRLAARAVVDYHR
ncbi:Dabb family protein [Nocardia higoensis]|uniref:Dabb family protein n=1 Tax=Nocardia higoensis TaxID=228599 RepID=UPI000314EAF3|nr:Dabb family protein [Nocardia higoensis]